jgi:predicted dienelactone hydrolase
MTKGLFNKLLPIISPLVFLGLAMSFTPAQAVHECGDPGKGKDHEHDHKVKDKKGKKSHKSMKSSGCKHLKETDFFNGDARADAPELAYRGDYAVGVQTVDVVNHDEIDILNWSAAEPNPLYDRELTLEVWYPARLEKHDKEITTYHDVLGSGEGNPDRPLRPFEFGGRAARGAMPNLDGGPYPLVIVSHGFPGSRVLLTYLTENLASKGYVVVAIDHRDSTHADANAFYSTLLNRTLDINFVLDEMGAMGISGHGFLSGMVDADNTAIVGYSMGGYGALNAAGAGYTAASVDLWWGVPGGHLARLQEGTDEYAKELDPRIRAMVALAPWGGCCGFWDPTGLAGIEIPSLFIVGKQDQTSGYANVEWLFDNAVNSDRYLLTYESAIHEIAVNPAPPLAEAHYREYVHYQEPGWDNRRLNNINQHFITAFLGSKLKGDFFKYQPYLDLLEPISNDSPRSDESDPEYWKGFPNWSAIGMELHHVAAP